MSGGPRQILALLRANAIYWPSVAPLVRAELAGWWQAAAQISDPELRALALEKLAEEAFNAEVAATLATSAPRTGRRRAVPAIVALELLFDYLDGRTERPTPTPLEDGHRAFAIFTEAVALDRQVLDSTSLVSDSDGAYLHALGRTVGEHLALLPAAGAVAEPLQAAAERCATAQTQLHADAMLGGDRLEAWAMNAAVGSGLGWREYAGGAASSVLAMHALIAAASDPSTTAAAARDLDGAYLAIGAVITMLDSLADARADSSRGEPGFLRLFDDQLEAERTLIALTREALSRIALTTDPAHHAMTLAGIAAYYTTHPGAREGNARRIAASVCRELTPAIWPTLAVMSAWRTVKRLRSRLPVRDRASPHAYG